MVALLCFLLRLLVPFKSTGRLEAENAALRHQLIMLQRKVHGRVQFANSDRLFFSQLYHWFPSVLKGVTIIRPETVVRWHCAGFRRYWCWKSRNPGGRPRSDVSLRALIRRMSIENRLWGAAHSRRAPQARVRGGSVDRGQVHGQDGAFSLKRESTSSVIQFQVFSLVTSD
jgi:hypothetical protein